MSVLRRYGFTLLLLLVGIGLWISRKQPDTEVYEIAGATMGTLYSVKFGELPRGVDPSAMVPHITDLLDTLDRGVMSTYVDDSELSQFNRAPAGEFVPVSQDLANVIHLALEISQFSSGAFDVTVGPLVNRWGFGPASGASGNQKADRVPDDEEISTLLRQVGYQHLQVTVSPPQVRKHIPLYVDLSGIAKGYAVDRLSEYLDELQISSYFIEIGGELRMKGLRPDGNSWMPAIEKPHDQLPEVFAVFYSHGESIAVAGSGDYRMYFREGGKQYSHEIDPRTGRPVEHNLAAVNVIADSAARADALATAFMVMGEEQAFALAQAHGIAASFISRRGIASELDASYTDTFIHYLQQPE